MPERRSQSWIGQETSEEGDGGLVGRKRWVAGSGKQRKGEKWKLSSRCVLCSAHMRNINGTTYEHKSLRKCFNVLSNDRQETKVSKTGRRQQQEKIRGVSGDNAFRIY